MKLGEAYDIFIIIYIQIYMLYNSNVIKFDLIIHDIINKERCMLAIKKSDIVIFVYRNNKDKQFVKSGFDDSNFINREICAFYKIVDRKFKHLFIKC